MFRKNKSCWKLVLIAEFSIMLVLYGLAGFWLLLLNQLIDGIKEVSEIQISSAISVSIAFLILTVMIIFIAVIISKNMVRFSEIIDMLEIAFELEDGFVDDVKDSPENKMAFIKSRLIILKENNAETVCDFEGKLDHITKENKKFKDDLIKAYKKCQLYEMMLDAIPFGIQVMNEQREWIYLNKKMEDVLVMKNIADQREKAYGMQCSNGGSAICKTEQCGVNCLEKTGQTNVMFDAYGKYFDLNTVHLIDKDGQKHGYLEISTDITPYMRVNAYTADEINRLEKSLLMLAQGDLSFDLNIAESDQHTQGVYEQFKRIEMSLNSLKAAIENLSQEADMLTRAALSGQIGKRADQSHLKGSWQKLLLGINNIFEEFEKPIHKVYTVMEAVSAGDLNVKIEGSYQGVFEKLQESVNTTTAQLNDIIEEISRKTVQISQGNLNIDSSQNYPGQFNMIAQSLNSIMITLNDFLREIIISSSQVNASANQLSNASQSLAQGSTEQASSIEELTASIANVANQAVSSSEDANKARELTKKVIKNADHGSQQMQVMQKAMDQINQSSKGISGIIKVIDDIAFQTNILALNAAVEAARAGQHGKGFAVVAEEVRSLAGRSAEAASKTTLLIEGSISKVSEGTKIAEETATALMDIVKGINETAGIIDNIALVSKDQACETEQIKVGLDQISQVVIQNAALSQQSASASEELLRQAQSLKSQTELFKVRN